jgi:hypothetical protein
VEVILRSGDVTGLAAREPERDAAAEFRIRDVLGEHRGEAGLDRSVVTSTLHLHGFADA